MPGMTSGIGTGNTLIAEAFRSALRLQLFIVAGIFALLWVSRLIAASSWPMLGRAGTGRPAGDERAASDEALAAGGSRLAVWRVARGSASWRQVQVWHVPVASGSSS